MSEPIYKIMLLGDSGVGKTSILLRFTDDIFTKSLESTIGVDFKMKSIKVENTSIQLQIWDTAGQESHQRKTMNTYTTSCFRGANGVILVYDITQKSSFEDIHCWLLEINKYGNDCQKIIVGNKTDLEESRAVSIETAIEYAESIGLPHIETSALNGEKIESLFYSLAENIVKTEEIEIPNESPVKIINLSDNKNSSKHAGGCCK